MIAGSEPAEPKPEAAEPVKVAEPEPEAVQEPAETKQQPTEADEPLPEGVQKRIAKEVEKASAIQRKIDEAVSTRKAKEKELADVTATGSQPEPTSAAATKVPEYLEAGHENESWAEFHQRELAFERGEMRKAIQAEFDQRHREASGKAARAAGAQAAVDAGAVKSVAEFDTLLTSAEGIAPEALQRVIGALDNWSLVAMHLAKDHAKLRELAAEYEANPVRAIAKLGRIEASLKSATKPAAEPLPNPPAKEGGGGSATVGSFDIEKASMGALRLHIAKIRKAG